MSEHQYPFQAQLAEEEWINRVKEEIAAPEVAPFIRGSIAPVVNYKSYISIIFAAKPDDFMVADGVGGARLFIAGAGGSWREDKSAVIDALESHADIVFAVFDQYHRALRATDAPKEQRAEVRRREAELKAWLRHIKSRAGYRNLCAQSPYADDSFLFVSIDDLEGRTRYIGAPNGTLNIETGAHEPDPGIARRHLAVGELPDDISLNARHPQVDRLTAHLLPEVEEYFFQELAYSLRGHPDRRVLLLLGETGGGKSTLASAISRALGRDYAATGHEDALTPKKNSSGLSPSMESHVFPRRVVFVHEGEKIRFAPDRLKTLSGGDLIQWRPMYQDPRVSRVSATLCIVANTLPRIDLLDNALMSRLRVLPYPAIPTDQHEENFLDAFHDDPTARQALIAKIAGAYVGKPKPPQAVIDASKAAYQEMIGEVGVWLMENLTNAPSHKEGLSTAEVVDRLTRVFGEADAKGRIGDRTVRTIQRAITSRFGPTKAVRDKNRIIKKWSATWRSTNLP